MTIEIKSFDALSLKEFHEIIALRIAVFVVEQNCPYQELDGKDKECHHVILRNLENEIIGTARILPPGISYAEIAVGRVAIVASQRKTGLGHSIMEKSLHFIAKKWGNQAIKLSAQSHLTKFYQTHGFVSTGKEYLEDGIPHTEMILTQ